MRRGWTLTGQGRKLETGLLIWISGQEKDHQEVPLELIPEQPQEASHTKAERLSVWVDRREERRL